MRDRMADYVAGYTQKMDDSDSHSPDSLVVEMGESLRMVEARRRKKNAAQRSDGWMVQETTKKYPETVSPLQISSEASPGNSKDLAAITKSLPTTFLSYGKVIAIKMGKNMKDLLGCLGLDDEEDVVDPRTVRKIAKQHHRSHGHQQSTSKDKDPRQPFSFPPCPALPSDQPWVDDLLVANKDALWIIFYHFSDNNQSESYITVPKLQELLSICGVYPALVTSRDLSFILAEGVGGKIRSDTDRLSFVLFVQVLLAIAERALIIIPEQQDSTVHHNLRLAMLLHLMETHCDGKLPPFDLHFLEEQRTKAAVRKRIEITTTTDHDNNHSNRKKEKGRHFLEEFASGICGYDDSSDSS